MVDESTDSEEFSELAGIENITYLSINNLLFYITKLYGNQFESEVQLNRFLSKILATALGDLLGQFPEEGQEAAIVEAHSRIDSTSKSTKALFHGLAPENLSDEDLQLLSMKPAGRA